MNKQDETYVADIAAQLGQMPEMFGAKVVMKLLDIIESLEADNSSLKKTVLMAFGLPGVKNYLQLEAENASLKAQLRVIKKVGEPFMKLDKAVHSGKWVIEQSNVWYGISLVNLRDTDQTISIADPEIHALAGELEKVKDG